MLTTVLPLSRHAIMPHGGRWTAAHYVAALDAMAETHAESWDCLPGGGEQALIADDASQLIKEARVALLEIEQAPWRERFFPGERLHAWLEVLDQPDCLLDILSSAPRARLHSEHSTEALVQFACLGPHNRQSQPIGPAPYDLASLHSLARWRFGSLPFSLVEMRSYYLQRLQEHLGAAVDRSLFDAGIDAARAWRFATLWPIVIRDHHTTLLAGLHHLRATVTEPAYASLRRCAA